MSEYNTLEYKKINDSHPVLVDVYSPPLPATMEVVALPVVIFFHGGALTMGNRQSFSPTWLKDRVLSLGYAFLSFDYRLLVPTTVHEVIEDLQDAFTFVANNNIQGKDYTFKLDRGRIAVAGNSAGGLCAVLAAIHCTPRPKVLIDIYGMGGNFFTEYHLGIKPGEITLLNQVVPHLEPAGFIDFTYPYVNGLPPVITECIISDDFLDEDPGKRSDPRTNIYNFYFQRGNYLDYYTGLHSPSISESLRGVLSKEGHTLEDFKRVIPTDKHSLFPQLSVDANWPPTVMIHGTIDDAVLIDESRNLRDIVQSVGVPVKLIEVEGELHGWDCYPTAEATNKAEFDAVKEFVEQYL